MMTEEELKSTIEALIYVADEPISEDTLVDLLGKDQKELIRTAVHQIIQQYQSKDHGIEVKHVAGGLKMATKPEHHEWVRKLVKHLTPPMRLSLAALETLAVIGYRQPITLPEIQEVRGVNAGTVLKTLIEKKLITTAGRKNVIGRPILYRTTKEFLIQFGLKDLHELPSLEEFEELAQASLDEEALLTGVDKDVRTDGSEMALSTEPSLQGTENRERENPGDRPVDEGSPEENAEDVPPPEI
jgi:segregation and condensation protein B